MKLNRYSFQGKFVAVAGMGVSGIAAAETLARLGSYVTVFEEKPAENPNAVLAVDRLQKMDISCVTSWHGHLDPNEFDMLILSPGFPRNHPSITDMRDRPILSEVELGYAISEAPIIAITGTNGKSTTTVLTWLLVNASGKRAKLCGNIAGSGFPEEPISSAALNANYDDILVAEVSSFQLEFVQDFRPRAAAITNVTPDHLERHPSFQDYFETKLRIFKNMGEGDTIVLNSDEQSVTARNLRESLRNGAELVCFSPGGNGIQQHSRTQRFGNKLELSGFSLSLQDIPIPGEHNIANLMMAWDLASAVCDPGSAGIDALKEFTGLEHRIEYIGSRGGVRVINNSMCTNPKALIESTSAIHAKQHILLGGNTKDLDYEPVRKYLRTSPHSIYLFGSQQDHLNEMLGGGHVVYNDLREAFVAAVNQAHTGEVIILSPGCASSQPFTNFKERGWAFKKLVMEWIKHGKSFTEV